MPIKKLLKAKALRYIDAMLAAVTVNPKSYNQNNFPRPGEGGVCSTPFCAAGHIIYAKSPRLFERLCKLTYETGSADWGSEAMKALGLDEDVVNTSALFGSTSSWPSKYQQLYRSQWDNDADENRAARVRVKAFKAYWKELVRTNLEFARH